MGGLTKQKHALFLRGNEIIRAVEEKKVMKKEGET